MFKTFLQLMKSEQLAKKYFLKILSISILSAVLGIYFGIVRMKGNGEWNRVIADVDPNIADQVMLSATVSYVGLAVAISILSSIFFTTRKFKKND